MGKSLRPVRVGCSIPALILCAILVATFCSIASDLQKEFEDAAATAKAYECPQVDIAATVDADGNICISEQRSFSFTGPFTAVWWELGTGLPWYASVRIDAVSMVRMQPDGAHGALEPLAEVPFESSWRTVGGPGRAAFSFDEEMDTVYAFFDERDCDALFQLDYTVLNGVARYTDAAEVYWKFVGDGWAVDSSEVTLTMTLPVPEGASVQPGENVRAWAHGPLDGTIAVGEDGVVTAEAPSVEAGAFAEVRATFPVAWLAPTTTETMGAERRIAGLDRILREEGAWAERADRERARMLTQLLGVAAACAAGLLVAGGLFLIFGREHRPSFRDKYWRDVPEPGMPPAIVGCIWRWGEPNLDDLLASIIHLCNIGALKMGRGIPPNSIEQKEEYSLTRVEPAASQLTDPIDRETMELLFTCMADGAETFWMGDFKRAGKKQPTRVKLHLEGWRKVVMQQAEAYGLFDQTSALLGTLMAIAGGIYLFMGINLSIFFLTLMPLLLMWPTGIALIILSRFMRRRTRYAADILARSKALKRWLCHFSSLDERPPTDVAVWGRFMVYASLFGVADRAIKELSIAVLAAVAPPAGPSGPAWHAWYEGGAQAVSAMSEMSIDFQKAVSGTLRSIGVREAASSVFSRPGGGSGSSSSRSGGGGGFSRGGGGGFGGGGGAR